MAELEALLDRLATELNRQVVLEGADFELVAYSRPKGEMDEVRVNTILSRHAPPAVRGCLESGGLRAERDPWRLDSAPELGMKSRMCVPVRSDGEFLGAMWMIDADRSIDGNQMKNVGHAVPNVIDMLLKRCNVDSQSQAVQQDLFRRLMLPDGEVSAAARRELEDSGLFEPSDTVAVYLIAHAHTSSKEANRAVERGREEELRVILERCRWSLKTNRAGYFVSNGTGVLLVGSSDRSAVAEQLLAAAGTTSHKSRFIVAESGEGTLDQASKLMRQAKMSLLVARSIGGTGSVVRWDQLGIYQVLSSVAGSEYLTTSIHPGLMAAINAGDNDSLLETLECYLDSGGSVKATTEKLTLHRTSLYYRLERIEKMLQVNVHNGEDRMALHIGLKLARLAGLYGGASHAAGAY